MFKKIFLFLSGFLAMVFGCKTNQYTIDNFPPQQIRFGGGGGFTGHVTEYILLENGQVFKHYPLREDTTEIKALKKKEAQALFEKADSLQILTLKHHYPGNMYYYINHQTAEANNTITWGLPDHPISDTLYQYMKLLLEKVEDDEVRLPMQIMEE